MVEETEFTSTIPSSVIESERASMLFRIYGLRVAGTDHIFLIGQTHQSLHRRREKHIERARKHGHSQGEDMAKARYMLEVLESGRDIEIVEIDTIEAEPRIVKRRDGSEYAIASLEVSDREAYWQQKYLSDQGGPMFVDGELAYTWSEAKRANEHARWRERKQMETKRNS